MVDAENKVGPFGKVHGKRNVGGSGVHCAELCENPHCAALRQKGNLVALLKPQGHKACADAIGLSAGLFLGIDFPFSSDFFAEIGVVGELMSVEFDEINNCRSFCHSYLSFI